MIPIELTLRNFMSYGDPGETLSLEGLHVACLSGDNGNGKSALLDAMTWALWGKTRASGTRSASEDDLIRLGADEVEARLEFELNERRYRVVRKRKRGRAGVLWELTQLDPMGAYTPIGGGGAREVERRIVELLGMEYETFLNSAYLQQGKADEFTRQTPDNRKRILAEILGLSRYDTLEARARELYRNRKEAVDDLEREIRLLDAQIATRDENVKAIGEARGSLNEASAGAEASQERANDLRDRCSRLQALATTLREMRARLDHLDRQIVERRREHAQQAVKIGIIRDTIGQRESIEGDYARCQETIRRRNQLEPEMEAFNKASQDLKTVTAAIEIEEAELRNSVALTEVRQGAAHERRARYESTLTAIAAAERELSGDTQIDAKLDEVRQSQDALQSEFTALRTRNERLKIDVTEIDEVLALLAEPKPTCPICDSDLSGVRHANVVKRQQARRAEFCREQSELKERGQTLKTALNDTKARLTELGKTRDAMLQARSRVAQLSTRRDELMTQGIETASHDAELEVLRGRLEREEFAAPRRAAKRKIEGEMQRLGMAKAEYEVVRDSLRKLEGAGTRFEELKRAEEAQGPETAAEARLVSVVSELAGERDGVALRVNELGVQVAGLETLRADAVKAEREAAATRERLTSIRVTIERFETYLRQCAEAEETRKSRRAAFKTANEESHVYRDLQVAFGKRGIQALIIENAIPELQDEANSLLARLTDNAMQVSFETTRMARAGGGDIETLDIRITDDAGTRPYELYSGGEAFRVNFAVRVALSRLLARRSGAKLQTLILDEGFGTQDGKGREKLVEVIDAIKDDFERIIVITHVDELKDAFAQRIEITKDAGGSRIHMM